MKSVDYSIIFKFIPITWRVAVMHVNAVISSLQCHFCTLTNDCCAV